MTEAGVTGGDVVYRRSGGASFVLTTWQPRKGGRVDKLIRVGQIVVVVVLLVWLGQYIKDEFSRGMGPLDAVAQAVAGTASFGQTVFDAMTDDLRLRARNDRRHAHVDPQALLVELDDTESAGARGRIKEAFAATWPDLQRPGDTFLIHHRYERGTRAAVWAERTSEKTLRGSGEGLLAYVEAADAAVPAPAPAAPVAPPEPDPTPDEEDGPTLEAAQANQPPPPPPPPAPGTAGSIVRNISGDIVGFTGASRIKFVAITEDMPHDKAVQALQADGYKTIDEVGDKVLMGLSLRYDMQERLESGEGMVTRGARYVLYGVVPILLILSLLVGARGARWSLTVPHKKDPPRVYLRALYTPMSKLEEQQNSPVIGKMSLWVFRLFVYALLVWFLLVLLAGGIPTGIVWLVPFMLASALFVLVRLWRDQRALVATVARSMQLHDFTDEVIGQFARENAALINEGAERIVTPYYGMGSSSASVVNERLMALWTDIMGRQPRDLADILERQKQAALSLLREANTVGPQLMDEDGTLKSGPGDPKVPDAGPAFGLIRKGYRGSGATKTTEGGEDAELTSRPAIVKFVLMVVDAIHTWLDDKLLANRAKRLANAVQQRRLLGRSLQDARTMSEDLEAREIKRALDRAEVEARLAKLSAKKRKIKRKARQGEAEAEEDFDHDYEDDDLGDVDDEADNGSEAPEPDDVGDDDSGAADEDPDDTQGDGDRDGNEEDDDSENNGAPDRS